ncbi:MAG: hypothetical protein WCH57_12400 [Verrucomicrobiota bacterium]
MPDPHRRPVEDFEAILRAISKQKEPVILVGGHAVNVWALSYLDRLGKRLAPLQPFTSGDMDVFATRNALMGLYRELGGKLLLSGPREIIDGTLIFGVDPDTRELDVLRRVNGIPKIEAQSAIAMDVCGYVHGGFSKTASSALCVLLPGSVRIEIADVAQAELAAVLLRALRGNGNQAC